MILKTQYFSDLIFSAESSKNANQQWTVSLVSILIPFNLLFASHLHFQSPPLSSTFLNRIHQFTITAFFGLHTHFKPNNKIVSIVTL